MNTRKDSPPLKGIEVTVPIAQPKREGHFSSATEFKSGNVPHNKGRRMTTESREESRKIALRKYNGSLKRREYMKKYGQGYRESGKKSEVGRRYYQSPRGRTITMKNVHNRFAREISAPGKFDPIYWTWLCRELNFFCQICGYQFPLEKLTVDHIIPLNKGGGNNWENIQPLCLSCNCRKQDGVPDKPLSNSVLHAQHLWQGYALLGISNEL